MPETEPPEETRLVHFRTVCGATVTESWTIRVPRHVTGDPQELADWITDHMDEQADFQSEQVDDEHDRDVIKDSIHVEDEPEAACSAGGREQESAETVFTAFDQLADHALEQGQRVLSVIRETLAAMFPAGDYVRVWVDEDDHLSLISVVAADGAEVHRFTGALLPDVPAPLAAQWGAVDFRQEAQIENYADAAYQTGAGLDALPPVAHEPGEEPDAQCLALRAHSAASRIAFLRDAPADQPAEAPF